ncbi:MAG TPA: YbaK/EbsC family protein [Anaerolineales bacterium]
MRFRELAIQTQREAPNNARSEGAAFLVRAAYLSRDGELLPLGERAVDHLRTIHEQDGGEFFSRLSMPVLSTAEEIFFPVRSGASEILHCPACGYTARADVAAFRKFSLPVEDPQPMEKVATPGANTIESLANFLGLPQQKTAKALMFTRKDDGRFIFVVVRGDMVLSEAKLQGHVGEIRLASAEEIRAAGVVPGYASPVGLRGALIAVDELVPVSANLVAGANEEGFHLLNVNCGRDYQPEIIADLALAHAGDPCMACNTPLDLENADILSTQGEVDFKAVLVALAESNHDGKGLALPAAPFDVYLMHVPGKEMDTRARAEDIYQKLEAAGLRVLFDDRDERAGVKFNDADLIGAPARVTAGERALKQDSVEIKARRASEATLVPIEELVETIQRELKRP